MPGLSGRRCAVVGATGFIGSHLVERLVSRGATVLAVARSARRLHHLDAVRDDIEIRLCDILDPEPLGEAMTAFAPDTLFHLADQPDAPESFAQMTETLRVNVLGLLHVLESATRARADLFVYADSSKVYGNGPLPYTARRTPDPICSYAVAKAAGWQYCLLSRTVGGPPAVGLRPSMIYGPRQNRNLVEHVRECAAAERPVRLQGGSQTRDPLFVADAIDAFVAAAERPEALGHSIPIGGGEEISVTDLSRLVLDLLGSTVPLEPSSLPLRPTEIWRSRVDNADAARLLGWQPRVPLREGLARTLGDASVSGSGS